MAAVCVAVALAAHHVFFRLSQQLFTATSGHSEQVSFG